MKGINFKLIFSFIIYEIIIITMAVACYQLFPSSIKKLLRVQDPHVKILSSPLYDSAQEYFKMKSLLLSEKYDIPPPQIDIVSTPRQSFYDRRSEKINFDSKDLIDSSSEFTFYHEYAHHLQTHDKIKNVNVRSFIYLWIFLWFMISFYLFTKRKIYNILFKSLFVFLFFLGINKGVMINEFYADAWAHDQLEKPELYKFYYSFFNHEKRAYQYYKQRFGLLSWALMDHPNYKTRQHVHRYPNTSVPWILWIDFKNHYQIRFTDPPSFKVLDGENQ